MGVDLDGEVPIVGTELYDTDFDAFVEVRRRVPRPFRVPRCPELPSPQISRRASSRAKTDQPRPFLVPCSVSPPPSRSTRPWVRRTRSTGS